VKMHVLCASAVEPKFCCAGGLHRGHLYASCDTSGPGAGDGHVDRPRSPAQAEENAAALLHWPSQPARSFFFDSLPLMTQIR
jgi:hypothetical protein